MTSFHRKNRKPKDLTEQDLDRLLEVTGYRAANARDHVLYSLAIGTGMRECELAALTWEIVLKKGGQGRTVRTVIEIGKFKGSQRIGGTQEVELPPDCQKKLYALWKRAGQPTSGPVFVSRQGGGVALSTRGMRAGFAKWQERAQLERRYTFHSLRHTFCRLLKKVAGNDLAIVRRGARHARLETTMIYVEPSDDDYSQHIRKVRA